MGNQHGPQPPIGDEPPRALLAIAAKVRVRTTGTYREMGERVVERGYLRPVTSG